MNTSIRTIALALACSLVPEAAWAKAPSEPAPVVTPEAPPEPAAKPPVVSPPPKAPSETSPTEVVLPAPESPSGEPSVVAPAEPPPEGEGEGQPEPEVAEEPPPAPTAEPPKPEPPEPKPEPEAVEKPIVTTLPGPTSAQRNGQLRTRGIQLLASGGVLALTGVAVVIGFTAHQNRIEDDILEREDELATNDCVVNPTAVCDPLDDKVAALREDIRTATTGARVGGILLTAGGLTAVIGAILFVKAKHGLAAQNVARVQVLPTLGGLTLHGRF